MLSHKLRLLPVLISLAAICSAQTPVIFDTDMGNDIDDALALAMLHALTSRHECRLLGVTLTNGSEFAVPYVRMLNRFYGRPALPVGAAQKHLKGGEQDGYLSAAINSTPAEFRTPDTPAEPAVTVLRRLLASSPEKVTLIQVGFSTNLAALLESRPDAISPLAGPDLIKAKVALLSAMAGNFVEKSPEYNVKIDIPAARVVFEDWPTPIIFSGFEIGRALLYPATSILRDYTYAPWHPVAISYRAYQKMPYDRPTWDLTAALFAIRPTAKYFGLSAPGKVHIEDNGTTRFEPGSSDRQYLILDPAQKARVLEALTLLSSEPPH